MREEFITAECEFFPEGRKSLPEINGDSYRPHLLPENGAGHLGVSFYRGMAVRLGKPFTVAIRLAYEGVDYSPLRKKGGRFFICEGAKKVGKGRVL